MDVDWCLSCERKLDDFPAVSGPYCSPECLSYAQPSSSIRANPCPPPSEAFRIRQWAQAIPPHIPAGAPIHPFADSPAPSPLPVEHPPSSRSRLQSTPKLIERTSATTPLPTLCVSSPAHVRPLPPARASSRTYSQPTTTPSTMASMSEASTSLTSLLTEPMVATPDEDHSFGANIGALVRSWVNRDRASSTKSTKEDYVVEKVTDYFPPPPQGKKNSSSPSSKKLKKTHFPSPAPSFHHLPSAKKIISSAERDRSTPTHNHTPTPVVFPSCRAAEPNWVDDEEDDDDEIVAPQPQYTHKIFEPHQQYERYWTRGPSLSSVSSTGSSVLLMATKRWDGVRGRKDGSVIAV